MSRVISTIALGQLADEMIEGRIIGGPLDDDFYKETMGAYIHRYYVDVEIESALTNRSNEPLAKIVREQDLADELDVVRRDYRYSSTHLAFLRGIDMYKDRMFPEEYLQSLKGLELPPYHLSVTPDHQFDLRFRGVWGPTSRWEIPALAVTNQLRNRALMKNMTRLERDAVIMTGVQRLHEKIAKVKAYPGLTFSDFGTRRRFSRAWQRYVDQTLAEALPGQFLGTSNTEAAMDFGLMPVGTSAHELFMVVAALLAATDDGLLGSHNRVLREWWDLYGWALSIALTDTFGTDFFFDDMTKEQAEAWKGLRQDSGDAFEFAEKAIAFFQRQGINPLDKLLIFSDGLDMDMILELWTKLEGRIKRTFGWGTLLTNDLGIKPISIVVKVVRVRRADGTWVTTVKLSDNAKKHMGDPEEVEHYKRVFHYGRVYAAECRV